MDPRLKILATIAAVAVIVTGAYFSYFLWSSCAKCQYGDSANWPEHVSDPNNLAFRYPSGFDIIVPEDEANNPVSIVKKGERGESVLMQVGTLQNADILYHKLDDAVKRYEQAVSRRRTRSRNEITVSGFPGVMLVQDEPGGRRVVETLVWDAAEGGTDGVKVREVSLQLPGNTDAIHLRLYQAAFRELVDSLEFINFKDNSGRDRPSGIPLTWIKYVSSQGGYALWHPRDWTVAHEAQEEGGIYTVAVQPADAAKNKETYDSGKEPAFIVHAGPKDKPVVLSDLDAIFAQPFRLSIEKDTRAEEKFTFPGFGPGISLQGHQAAKENNPAGVVYLVITTAVGANPELTPSRGYVVSAFLPDGDAQKEYENVIRRITRSMQPLNE